VNGTPLTVVTVVVPSDRVSGGLVAASSTMSDRDENRETWLSVPGPNSESVNVELQVTSEPEALQVVSEVIVTPSLVKVCTERWLDATVRQLAAELPVVVDELPGLLGEALPPPQANAPAQTMATPSA